MSTSVLPVLPGLEWNSVRSPVWSTLIKESVAGRIYATSRWSYPRWKYKLSYSVLRARPSLAEMQQMAGFFNLMKGRGDTFLFSDPDDYIIDVSSPQQFGVGDGTTTKFQLLRSFGGYLEPVLAPQSGTVAVYKNGVNDGLYSVGSDGVITFGPAPGAGVVLTWAGHFYWKCRFLQDNLDFNQFMKNFWELRALEFMTEKA